MNRWLALTIAALLAVSPQFAGAARDDGLASLRESGKAFAAVARKAGPAVVFIQTEGREQPREDARAEGFPFGDDLFRRFFGDDFPGLSRRAPTRPPRRAIGHGSGFVFAHGPGEVSYVLTNSHVVEDAERIRVRLQDGREFDARVRGIDPKSDVAVLEIPVARAPALAWGDSAALEVGEWVVALGNPFGLSHTLTVGVVSAKGRTSLGINDYEDFIQTDAAINPGNSGGPLVNLDGEVVGMNTAIFSRSGGSLGIGFAIPSNLARAIADQLMTRGRVVRGFLGVTVQALTPELAEALGVRQGQGVLVAQVAPDSPAARAGLQAGDVLRSFDGEPLTDGGHYRNRIALATPGSTVTLGVLRDGRPLTLRARVGQLDDEETLEPAGLHQAIGLAVRALTAAESERARLRAGQGVLVVGVARGSVAALAGIRPGSVILEVNRQPVGNAEEFAAALARSGDARVLLRLSENGQTRSVMLSWR